MKYFHRGRHRRNRFSITVSDIEASVIVGDTEADHPNRPADIILGPSWLQLRVWKRPVTA